MIFENELTQFGMAGLFILYLIYDKLVLMKSFQKAIEANTEATERLKDMVELRIKMKK